MDATDWRTQIQPDSRQSMIAKITETLKRHLPISGPNGLEELHKISVRFEEKIFTVATSQSDYQQRISLKLLTMETKSQTSGVANFLPLNTAGGSQNPQYPASHSMQSQVRNPGQLQISLANQSLAPQQLLSQKIQNDIANPGIQGPGSWSQTLGNHSNIEPNMDAADWKTLLQPGSRQGMVTKIVETLKRHLPITGSEGLVELDKIAVRFEEKIFAAAASQSDYLRKISLKLLTMETKSHTNAVTNSLPLNTAGGSQNPQDLAFHSMQSQVRNLGQSQISLANQSLLAQQQLLSQNIQNSITNPGDAGRPETHMKEPEVGSFRSWDGGRLETEVDLTLKL
ncbi:hypothetical protein MKX03_009850 [Papaver bracteatum]|nr:hypothetical protein MKX03_009850 [Papaver bracteatum]